MSKNDITFGQLVRRIEALEKVIDSQHIDSSEILARRIDEAIEKWIHSDRDHRIRWEVIRDELCPKN